MVMYLKKNKMEEELFYPTLEQKAIINIILIGRRLEKQNKGHGLQFLKDAAFEHMSKETYDKVYLCVENHDVKYIFENDITKKAKRLCDLFNFKTK